uniref:Uncharacterized protein n=1 Tax=Arundo donax TaxID=35708 RepID=A0A0A9D5A8_ARUDO
MFTIIIVASVSPLQFLDMSYALLVGGCTQDSGRYRLILLRTGMLIPLFTHHMLDDLVGMKFNIGFRPYMLYSQCSVP